MFEWLKWFKPKVGCTLPSAKEHFKLTDDEAKYIVNVCKTRYCRIVSDAAIYICYDIWEVRWKLFIYRHFRSFLKEPNNA